MTMAFTKRWGFGVVALLVIWILGAVEVDGAPHRILLDTDVDTDDFFAILYLLKLNRLEFELEVEFLLPGLVHF